MSYEKSNVDRSMWLQNGLGDWRQWGTRTVEGTVTFVKRVYIVLELHLIKKTNRLFIAIKTDFVIQTFAKCIGWEKIVFVDENSYF